MKFKETEDIFLEILSTLAGKQMLKIELERIKLRNELFDFYTKRNIRVL